MAYPVLLVFLSLPIDSSSHIANSYIDLVSLSTQYALLTILGRIADELATLTTARLEDNDVAFLI